MKYKSIFFNLIIFSSLFLVFIFSCSTCFGMTVETEGMDSLPGQLEEGEILSFTLLIDDIDDDISTLSLETNLLSANNEPIFDFGDSNKYISVNRFDQTIDVNLSSFPQSNYIRVMISGKAPSGDIKHTGDDTNLVTTTFRDSNLKYYELKIDGEPYDIETFELRIKKKEHFENTMQNIEIKELDGIKLQTRNLFEKGLVTEAQGFADEMAAVKLPDSLKLFGIVDVNSNSKLNIISILFLLIGIVLGALLYSRSIPDDDEE